MQAKSHLTIRQIALIPAGIKGGVFLQLQAIAADMLRLQGKHIFHRFLPTLQILPRQTVHQIHRQILESRLADVLDGADRLTIGMGTANIPQNGIIIALNAQTHPVKTFCPQPPQQPGIYGIRIGLKGNFGITVHIKSFSDGVHNGGQSLCPK